MKSFLSYVAKDLLNKYPNGLARIAVVFPNKRAALFLNQEIARISDSPVWSPAYITISEFFREQSTLTVSDSIKNICILHKVYMDITKKTETLDQFYGWGELLLADFDDIDKNLAPAEKVSPILIPMRTACVSVFMSFGISFLIFTPSINAVFARKVWLMRVCYIVM